MRGNWETILARAIPMAVPVKVNSGLSSFGRVNFCDVSVFLITESERRVAKSLPSSSPIARTESARIKPRAAR